MRDKVAKGRQAKGESHGASKLSESDVQAIRLLYSNTDRTQDELADMFEITQPCVSFIVNARNWSHVDPIAA